MIAQRGKLLVAGLVVTGALAPTVFADPAPITVPARFSYAAKFLCGVSTAPTTSPPKEPMVKRGNYATVVNIHNPYATDVSLLKKVALSAPQRFPDTKLIPPTKRFPDRLRSDHTLSVDCDEIVNLLTLNGTPPGASFIEGFLVIDSFFPAAGTASTAANVDVVTVTTTAASATASVNDHEIVPVDGKRLPAGTWPF
jgi:hypothetical protein